MTAIGTLITAFLVVTRAPASKTEPPIDLPKDGTIIPGALDPAKTPQMIIMTFDGAVNVKNYDHYVKVFLSNRTNPNGCPIRGTFFISHEYSDFAQIQRLHFEGHEIAIGTISSERDLDLEDHERWAAEMREILGRFANISSEDIIGMRAPSLKPGKNAQYEVSQGFSFEWDSSIRVPPIKVPSWPYTLDYKIPHECKAGTCPTRTFPGVWELPLNAHYVESFEGGYCAYMDECVLFNHDSDQVLEWLQADFRRHYNHNRAPYMMPFHTTWFQSKQLENGLHKFVDWVRTQPNVWFCTATQALTWIRDPRNTDQLQDFEGWDCKKRVVPPPMETEPKMGWVENVIFMLNSYVFLSMVASVLVIWLSYLAYMNNQVVIVIATRWRGDPYIRLIQVPQPNQGRQATTRQPVARTPRQRNYTVDEEKKMLEFVITRKAFNRIKRISVYKEMESAVPQRSAMSLFRHATRYVFRPNDLLNLANEMNMQESDLEDFLENIQ